MTIKISQLGNLTAVLGNIFVPVVANVAGTLTTVKGNVEQLKTYIITEVSADIANLQANAGAQAGTLATLTSNAAIQAGSIADTNTAITTANLAMKGYVDNQVSTLTSNASVQAGDIATLFANAGAQSASISTLQSDITTLTSNAAIQAGQIAAVAANVSASSYGNSNVASYLQTYTGNISAGNISTDGLEIGGNYTFTSNTPNLAVRQVLVANVSTQLDWVPHFGKEEFDDLIITYIPTYPGNANSFVSTPTRLEAREYVTATQSIFAPNIFAANLTSISGLNTANIRFFDNSLQTTAYTDAFTMANVTHWTSNVTTISSALNQLAERIWNLENP